MNLPSGYSISSYGDMVIDPSRSAGYMPALRKAIFPGCTVLDIGSGPGIFALLACQLGARRVYAVEPDPSIELARQLAKDNDYADRIQFFRGISTKINLPEPADVIVSDLRGVLPLFQHHLPSIIDARRRHLAPGGRLIPARDKLWAAVVENLKQYHSCLEPWVANDLGLNLLAGHKYTISTWSRPKSETGSLLSEPQQWAEIDYHTVESPDVSGDIRLKIEKSGTVHGLLVWFDSELVEGVSYSNRPSQVPLIYGQAFFPLERPVDVVEGDIVEATLAADLIEGDYVFRWNTRITSAGSPGATKAHFRQSTFESVPLSPETLRRHHAGYIPQRSEDAAIDLAVLSRIDGSASLETIALSISQAFPHRFATWQEALTHVIAITSRREACHD